MPSHDGDLQHAQHLLGHGHGPSWSGAVQGGPPPPVACQQCPALPGLFWVLGSWLTLDPVRSPAAAGRTT